MASEYGATRLFDTERLRSELDTLVHRLADRGVEGRIYLVGGAAMALAYYDEGERRMTADVEIGPPRLLLAMKLRAARLGRDNDDIAVLLRRCGVRSVEESRAVLDDCDDGEERFTEKARAIVEAALAEYLVLSAIPPFTLPPMDTGDSGS